MSKPKWLKKLLHIHHYTVDYSLSLWRSRYNEGLYHYRCKCGKSFDTHLDEGEYEL